MCTTSVRPHPQHLWAHASERPPVTLKPWDIIIALHWFLSRLSVDKSVLKSYTGYNLSIAAVLSARLTATHVSVSDTRTRAARVMLRSFMTSSNAAVSSACFWLWRAIFSLNFRGLFEVAIFRSSPKHRALRETRCALLRRRHHGKSCGHWSPETVHWRSAWLTKQTSKPTRIFTNVRRVRYVFKWTSFQVLIEGVCDDECFRTYLGIQWLFQAAITNTNKCKIYIEILAIKKNVVI